MSIPKALHIEKFAGYIESIMVLYLADDEFKAICDDYCTSKINTEKYQKKLEEDTLCKTEYENLSQELEKEILRYLTKINSGDD
jgi:hypothetical protein